MRSVSLLRGLFFARQSASTEELREHSHTLAIAGAILDRLQEVNRRKNSVFVVVFLPTLRDYQRGIPSSVEALRQEARRAGILWIDLMPDFRRLSPAEAGSFFIQPGQTRYSLGEGHYNVAVVGHPISSPPQQGSAEKWPLSLAELLWRRKALTAVLIISLAARIALVLKGGQFFYPDERRYLECFTFLHELRLIDLSGIAHQIYGTSAHLGFMFTGLPAAILHIAFLAMRGLPATQSSVIATAWVSGLCFTIPSVISIAVVYAISRRAAATSAEALLAAFLMACSTALFYYCRHFLPYDLSMALTLLALWLGLAERPTALTSVRCGFIAGLGMLTYNGYWAFSAMVLGIHVLHRVPNVGAAVKRTVLAFLAAISVPAGLTVVSVLLGKPSYLSIADSRTPSPKGTITKALCFRCCIFGIPSMPLL